MPFDRYPPTFQKAGAKVGSDNLRVLLLSLCTDGGKTPVKRIERINFFPPSSNGNPTDRRTRKKKPHGFRAVGLSYRNV